MVQTFVKKPIPIQAVRWTGYNYEEVKQLGGSIISREDATILNAHIVENEHCRIMVGDWLARDEQGCYHVLDHGAFQKLYEPVENLRMQPFDTAAIIKKLNDIQKGYELSIDELKVALKNCSAHSPTLVSVFASRDHDALDYSDRDSCQG